jgi:hypothetical protein
MAIECAAIQQALAKLTGRKKSLIFSNSEVDRGGCTLCLVAEDRQGGNAPELRRFSAATRSA